MGFLICSKCKSYYELGSGESVKDFVTECDCGGKLRYVENLDIVDPHWKQISFRKKSTKKEI
ncbi:MAG TPA: MFS transporter, partial [Methanobacterium sp.]|nr:MFS transporter [Methanobacterium sp.]